MLLSKAEKRYLKSEEFINNYIFLHPELKELIDIFIQIRDNIYEYSYPRKLSIMVGKQLTENTFQLYLRNTINACNVKVKFLKKDNDIFIYIKNKHESICIIALNLIKNVKIKEIEFKRFITFKYNGLDYQISL